jgi:hypothetical protein
LSALGRLGTYTAAGQQELADGDVVLYANSAFCVVKKPYQCYRGSYITLRELVTNDIRSVRIEPSMKLTRLNLGETVAGNFDGRWQDWQLVVGDVVVYPSPLPAGAILAIRHSHGWCRTEAPWTPFADAEIVLDVIEGRARTVRSSIRNAAADPRAMLTTGSVVATRRFLHQEPSVWFRKDEDYWVGNSRQAPLSDQMVRYELSRRTYEVLSLPEG